MSGLARLMGARRRIGSAGRPLPPFSVKYQTGMFDATSLSSKLLTRTRGECESPRRCAYEAPTTLASRIKTSLPIMDATDSIAAVHIDSKQAAAKSLLTNRARHSPALKHRPLP